ncbi:hypothetical protein [uncultured Pseudoalteromonas sp.]|uniref:hypothetical protein n=1 Tax=uncultured Pseudoalteromonas sp. TaxID=114053 RepID=UPI0025968E5F|nr:hypothetical protein [uncultured Pseudoalteromonas sp.]
MNNAKIKALAEKHEITPDERVISFAWALLQSGKPNVSHKQYLADLLKDAANCVPEKSVGYGVTIYANDVSADEPRFRWDFYNGVERSNFECRVPDTREELNSALNNAKGCMKSACYRAMNPDFDKKLA